MAAAQGQARDALQNSFEKVSWFGIAIVFWSIRWNYPQGQRHGFNEHFAWNVLVCVEMGRYTLHPSKTIHPGKFTAGTQFRGALEDCFPFHFAVTFRFQPLIFRGVPTKLESTNLNYFFWDDHMHSRGNTDLQIFICAVFFRFCFHF